MTDYSKFVVPPQQWTLQMANEEIERLTAELATLRGIESIANEYGIDGFVEIESLRLQLAYLQEELGNPPTDFHLLKQQLAECERERDELVAWQQAAFDAHPNIDMDIEYALAKLGADKMGDGS